MNIEELKVRNVIYKLGLTDEDFVTLATQIRQSVEGALDAVVVKHGQYAYAVTIRDYLGKSIEILKSKMFPTVPAYLVGRFIIGDQHLTETDITSLRRIQQVTRHCYGAASEQKNCTLQEMKNLLKKDLVTSIGQTYHGMAQGFLDSDNLSAVAWLFDDSRPIPDDGHDTPVIVRVWEHDNQRIALCRREGANPSDGPWYFSVWTPEDPRYNYVDEGRRFWQGVYVWDDVPAVNLATLQKCANNNEFVLVTKDIYDAAERRYALKIRKEQEQRELNDTIRKTADKRLRTLSKTPLVINGVRFDKTGAHYQGQRFGGTWTRGPTRAYMHCDTMEEFLSRHLRLDQLESVDFNQLYEQFCNNLAGQHFSGTLGVLAVMVTTAKTSNDSTVWHVNGIRINADEVVEMLKRAICFDTPDDYTHLLEKVSTCNLRFHDMLNNGLHIPFRDHELRGHGDDIKHLRFTVARKGACNYLVVGKKEHRIKDSNRLWTRSAANTDRRDGNDLDGLVKLFQEMFGFDAQTIAAVFSEGLRHYTEAVQRSEQWLAETLKKFRVTEIKTDQYAGYLVGGKSGRRYCITKDLKIYDADTNKYICVVDRNVGGGGFQNDRLVSRIYALANDSLVASQISTLQQQAP